MLLYIKYSRMCVYMLMCKLLSAVECVHVDIHLSGAPGAPDIIHVIYTNMCVHVDVVSSHILMSVWHVTMHFNGLSDFPL